MALASTGKTGLPVNRKARANQGIAGATTNGIRVDVAASELPNARRGPLSRCRSYKARKLNAPNATGKNAALILKETEMPAISAATRRKPRASVWYQISHASVAHTVASAAPPSTYEKPSTT